MKSILLLGLLVPSMLLAQEIKVPLGFRVTEIAKDQGSARHITVSKQGHVYD